MTIDKSSIWVLKREQPGSTATSLDGDLRAPDEFEDYDAVVDYIQNEYDGGEYTILTPERQVSVNRQQEQIFTSYTDGDIKAIDDAATAMRDVDANILSIDVIDDSDYGGAFCGRNGVELRVEPNQYDICAYALLDNEDPECVAKRFDGVTSDVRLIGWKKHTHHERRGARGEPAVRMYFKRPIKPFANLYSFVDECDGVLEVFDADIVTYMRVIENKQGSKPDAVVATTIEVDVMNKLELKDDTDDILSQAHTGHTEVFADTVDSETDWTVTSLGVLTTTEVPSLNVLALGLNYQV